MTPYRVAFALVMLVVMTALIACGEDDETTTVTVTEETASETPTGPAVAELQQVMTELGYYDGPIDGVYGEETTAGVEAMQEDLGVTVDGIYGPETHEALLDAADTADEIVVHIQTVLTEYGYYEGPIDGVYGEETTAAVMELQEDLGVTVDGRVGPETVEAFNEAVADGTITTV